MKILKIITALFCVFCVCFTTLYKLPDNDNNKNTFKGVLTLWHVETFEGGIGSRKQFLLKIAREFEREYPDVLVMVISHTVTSVKESVEQGLSPDLISYGNGVDITGLSEINVDKKFNGGLIGDKQFAIPWCKGAYVVIANPKLVDGFNKDIDTLLISQGNYNLSTTALIYSDLSVKKIEVLKPMDAYVKFVAGKTPYFLGTQRDVNRLINRGMVFDTLPLNGFNDLYQYISISSKTEENRFYAEKFIKFLLSDNSQAKLSSIGMLSEFVNLSYDNELNNLQNQKDFTVVSPFVGSGGIEEIKYLSTEYLSGNTDALIKIKNMTV